MSTNNNHHNDDDNNSDSNNNNNSKTSSSSLIYEKNAMITHLEQEVAHLMNQISNLSHTHYTSTAATSTSSSRNNSSSSSSRSSSSSGISDNRNNTTTNAIKKLKNHKLNTYAVDVGNTESKCGKRRQLLTPNRTKIGRNASIATTNALNGCNNDDVASSATTASLSSVSRTNTASMRNYNHKKMDALIQRIMDMFKDPAGAIHYMNSEVFAKDIITLSRRAQVVLQDEPRCVFLQSPAYVFGDIHGNLEDLHFFSDNIWRLGMSLTAGSFVFLGDYVDRGMSCLECVSYLMAMKCQLPQKVVLLRGNHETRDVNGWEEHYGERSFIAQCRMRFGDELGFLVWEEVNKAFDRMPLSCVIDQDIFCVHGGIPRINMASSNNTNTNTRIQDILSVPRVAGVNPPYEHESEEAQQVASDCIWSDPASEEQEYTTVDSKTGFGESLRGGGAICFGHKAVTDFLNQHNYSYIMRAHEAHAEGVAVSKGARVFTVFSTSKDHNQGSRAMAGCILVDDEKMQVINRSPAYRNQYVHRRDSVSLEHLSARELEMRERVGLVIEHQASLETYDDDEEEEEWEDMDYDHTTSSSTSYHDQVFRKNNSRNGLTGISEEIEDSSDDEA